MYKLELTPEELNLVVIALSELPAKHSRELINKIEAIVRTTNTEQDVTIVSTG